MWLYVTLVVGLVSAVPVHQDTSDVFDQNFPEENPGLFEGDIELQPGQDPYARNAILDNRRLWPHGSIAYTIDAHHSAISSHVQVFKEAMKQIEDKTKVGNKKCISFHPRTNEKEYLQFTFGTGCHTPVGDIHRKSEVTLGNGCMRIGTVMHEILHALGFWHEQSRADRDNYVKIHFENIQSSHSSNFKKHTLGYDLDHLNTPYDYGSVMHYNAYAFAVDRRKVTIETLTPGVTIGQRTHLTDMDAKRIQILYGCIPRPAAPTGTGAITPAPTTADPHIVHLTSSPNHTNPAATCTFDSGLCNWTQEKTNTLNWTRRNGGTPSRNTGPHADHRGSTSAHYLYMEASGHFNKTANLLSPQYAGGQYCFTSYFHMYGSQTGSLSFNLLQHGRRYHMKTYTGDHGDHWMVLRLSVNVRATSFQFEIEGHTGTGYHSDIAIDDIAVSPGHC